MCDSADQAHVNLLMTMYVRRGIRLKRKAHRSQHISGIQKVQDRQQGRREDSRFIGSWVKEENGSG